MNRVWMLPRHRRSRPSGSESAVTRFDRQENSEDAPLTRFAFNFDPSAVSLDRLLRDRQSKPVSAGFTGPPGIGAVKPFEDFAEMLP